MCGAQLTAQRLGALPLGATRTGPIRAAAGWWVGIRAAGALPRPGAIFLALVVAAFLLAMVLVLQLQLQAARIASVNELERELAQLQRVQSALQAEAATASDLPHIQARALEIGMQPVEPAAIYRLPGAGGRSLAPPAEWAEHPPPALPDWRERFWQSLLRSIGRGNEHS